MLSSLPANSYLYNLSSGPVQTAQKVFFATKLIREGGASKAIQYKAIEIAKSSLSPFDAVASIHRYVTTHVKYQDDPHPIELFKGAPYMLAEIQSRGVGAGDCDDMVIFEGSLLKSLGLPVRIVMAWSEDNFRDTPNHIYLKTFINGGWCALEPTAKSRPCGFEGRFRRREETEV